MVDAVIVASARTPIGRSVKGSLAGVDAYRLAEVAVGAAMARAGIDRDAYDDLVLAESLQGGGVIARNVAVRMGLTGVPGLALNRQCASGVASIQTATASILAGMIDVAAAGGTESASTAPRLTKPTGPGGTPESWFPESHPPGELTPAMDMSITIGENTARLAGVSREQADAWAARSQQRAGNAIEKGYFDDEIVPVDIGSDGTGTLFRVDEHPRPDTTSEVLSQLRLLHPEIPNAVVTAGNSSGVNDAAAAVVVVSSQFALAHGLRPLARVRGWSTVGVEVERTGLAPTLAIPRALAKSGLALADLDLVEINEAFATMAVASTRALGVDESIVNVNGSGISLGHPIAATGTRMVVSLIHELVRRDVHFGVVSMCAGGGMGSALVIERM